MAHHLRPLRQPEPAVKTFRAVWGVALVIFAALSTGAGYAAKTIGLLDKKANVSDVRTDEDRIGAVERDVSALKNTADDLKDGQRWQIDFDLQVAQRMGVSPRPRPTPRAAPTPTETP